MVALIQWKVGSISSPWTQTNLCSCHNHKNTVGVKVCHFQGWVMKGMVASTLASWIHSRGERQLSCHEDALSSSLEKSMQRGPEAASLQPAPLCQLHEWVTIERDLPSDEIWRAQGGVAVDRNGPSFRWLQPQPASDCGLLKDPKQEPSSSVLLKFLINRKSKRK